LPKKKKKRSRSAGENGSRNLVPSQLPSAERIRKFVRQFRVKPGTKVSLPGDFDPASTAGARKGGQAAGQLLQQGVEFLADYQARLAADARNAVLVILQAMDAAGKDGTIRHVMSGVNPQGVQVHSFKAPSTQELAHDYLWRYATRAPARGQIGIFNRSYYEEVLVVRVHPELLSNQRLPTTAKLNGSNGYRELWNLRFDEINNFERYLAGNGVHIVKLFLNVSKEAQRQRFLARIDEPSRNWKFTTNDVRERDYWDDYQAAFSEVLTHTSTAWAPWYVIPADRKWFSRIASAAAIANALIEIDPQYPTVSEEARASLQLARGRLESEDGRGPTATTGRRRKVHA
jgi:PPK2 family polyphosphate:nucleotide phosphotransferase